MSTSEPYGARASAAESTYRETAKWIVGGIAATAAGVIVGSPLTGIGSLYPSELRFWLACGGALLGFLSLILMLRLAVRVIAAESISLVRVLDPTLVSANIREQLEQTFTPHEYPEGVTGFASLWDKVKPSSSAPKAEMEKINKFYDYFAPKLRLEFVRLRFWSLMRWGIVFVCGLIVGFGTFAWAASPSVGDEPLEILSRNRTELHPDDRNALVQLLGRADCVPPELEFIAYAQQASGAVDVILLPHPPCKLLRGTQFGERLRFKAN